MKKTKNKNLRRALSFLLLAALVAGLAAMPLLTADQAPGEEFPLSVLSDTAARRQISLDLRSGGSLLEQEGTAVTVPGEVRLTEFLAKNGDRVKTGDPIARVDRVTVMSAIASTQEAMAQLQQQLEKERTGSSTDTLKVPGGLVKKIYAQPGDSAEEVMAAWGALAVISLDGLMKLELPLESEYLAGNILTVQLDDRTLDAAVKSNLDGVLTVTFPDEGFEEGTEAILIAPDGTVLGSGPCRIHAPWNAAAYSGTVSYVSAREGATLYEGAVLLGLKDIPYSAAYRSLAAQHREHEERLLELFTLYQTLTLTAPCDGTVSGIDEDSAQLLGSAGGWQLQLLKNAPGENPDGEYVNFVGQVVEQGDTGFILRLDPALFSLTDYSDLSSLSRDTAAMTHEVIYTGGAPVYRWDGESWTESSFSVGDLLLFGGDATGRVVWVIPYDRAELPGEEPTEPTTPSEPTEPSDPTEPSEPTDPSEPTAPSEPSGSEEEPGTGTPGGSGGAGGSGGLGGLGGLGGITIPSFGGYSAYGGTESQQQPQAGAEAEVQVALVTPQDTVTLEIPVDELDLGKVRVGQQCLVTLEALGATFPGTVTGLSLTGTSLGGSSKFTATVTLSRQPDMLPGMNGSVVIPLEQVEGIAVPVAAVESRKDRSVVYTGLDPETGDPAQPVEVTTLASDGDYVLVEGLAEGSQVWYTYYEALEN